jgi:hypothetical protein
MPFQDEGKTNYYHSSLEEARNLGYTKGNQD